MIGSWEDEYKDWSAVSFCGDCVGKTIQNPNPSHTEEFGTPASFSRP